MPLLPVDSLPVLRRRHSAKWSTFDDDVLPLPVAEMDFALAEPVAAALTAAVQRSDTGYVPPNPELPLALSGFADRRWGWRIDPGQVAIAPDVGVGVVEMLRLLVRPGDPVGISSPVYAPFYDWLNEVGSQTVDVPLSRDDGGWRLDFEGLEAAFAAGLKVYVLCNPQNPVGLQHGREDLEFLAELAHQYGVYILSDEIHAPLVLPGTSFVPFLTVSEAARMQGFSFVSASKGWNLAGLKCAAVVTANGSNADVVRRLPEAVQYRTGLFGVLASTAAFEHGGPWLDDLIFTLDANRSLLQRLIKEQLPDVGYEPPQASYLAWLDFRRLDWGNDPAAHILENARVALGPGPRYGPAGAGHARLNFGTSPEIITDAVGRIAAAAGR